MVTIGRQPNNYVSIDLRVNGRGIITIHEKEPTNNRIIKVSSNWYRYYDTNVALTLLLW